MVRVLRDGAAPPSPICSASSRVGVTTSMSGPLLPLACPSLSMVGRLNAAVLPRAGLRGGDQVAAFEHLGDGLLLHRGGGAVTQLGHSLQCLARKAEVVEMRHIR